MEVDAMLSTAHTLRHIVTELPRAIPLLEELHLDYCCRGARSLAEACDEAGLDPAPILQALSALEQDGAPDAAKDPALASVRELVQLIVERHHRFARESIAMLRPLLAKVLRAHGSQHPELETLARTFMHVVAELEPHQLREEAVLFPAIIALAEHGDVTLPLPMSHPIARMSSDHDAMGVLLGHMAAQSNHFVAPPDACTSWRALYDGFAALERDLHMHIHLENNVLFPRALALAAPEGRPS